MTQEEIIEGNKLIASFMGYEKSSEDKDFIFYKHPDGKGIVIQSQHDCKVFHTHELMEIKGFIFHRSWDWLMPVVKKCSESFEHHQYDSEEYYHITEEIFHPDYSLSEFMDADIEAVYSRVVTYIKWYNQNKEK